MAAGGERGCSLAKNEKLHPQLRELWKGWLEACFRGAAKVASGKRPLGGLASMGPELLLRGRAPGLR